MCENERLLCPTVAITPLSTRTESTTSLPENYINMMISLPTNDVQYEVRLPDGKDERQLQLRHMDSVDSDEVIEARSGEPPASLELKRVIKTTPSLLSSLSEASTIRKAMSTDHVSVNIDKVDNNSDKAMSTLSTDTDTGFPRPHRYVSNRTAHDARSPVRNSYMKKQQRGGGVNKRKSLVAGAISFSGLGHKTNLGASGIWSNAIVPGDEVPNLVTVFLCVWFVKIEEIDTQKEQFSADAVIKARWREPAMDNLILDDAAAIDWSQYWDPKIYIVNTLGEPQAHTERMAVANESGEVYVYEIRRLRGVFLENLELEDFPFDVQDLTITIGSERPDSQIRLEDDPEEPHTVSTQFFVDAQEWHLHKHIASETEHLDKVNVLNGDDKTWTVRQVKCRASRRPGFFIWNVFLLTFLICCLVFISFAVDQDKPQNRLLLNFTLILTSVAAKSGFSKDLPKISYTTYSDRYMIGGMAFLTITCLWHGAVTLIDDSVKQEAEKLFICVLAFVFIAFNVGYVGCVYLFPYGRRRRMKEKDFMYERFLEEEILKEEGRNRTRENSVVSSSKIMF